MSALPDLIALIEPLARRFYGEPNQRLSRGNELRFGTNGSLSVDIKLGRWFDFEAKKGGGVLDLVKFKEQCASDREAFEWLEREGYWNGSDPRRDNAKEVVVETFPYRDRDGALSFVVERIEFQRPDGSFLLTETGKRKKTFRQKRPDPNRRGQWIRNVDGCPVLPYRLQELIEAIAASHRIYVVEGEGKVNLLWSWNVPATCNAGGAGGWTKEHAEYLRGADVVILGDADDVGRNFVRDVGTSLEGIAKSVRVLDLPGLGLKEDIKEWAERGGTVEALHELTEREAKPFRREDPVRAKALPFTTFRELGEQPARKLWIIKNVIARNEVSSWFGPPGSGKSALAADISIAGSGELDWRGYLTKIRCGVVYFALERADLTKRRLLAYKLRDGLIDCPIAVVGGMIDLLNKNCVDEIVDTIRAAEDRFACEVGLAIFDTFAKGIAAGGGDEDKARDQNAVHANMRRETKGERGSNARRADVDLQVQITGDLVKVAKVIKGNDQPEGVLTSFRLEPFDFGPDEDGEPFQTFIVSPETVDATEKPRQKTTDRQKLALRALAEATLARGREPPVGLQLPPDIKAVTAQDWLDELLRANVLDPEKNLRGRFGELRTGLAARNLIGTRDDFVWLPRPPSPYGGR